MQLPCKSHGRVLFLSEQNLNRSSNSHVSYFLQELCLLPLAHIGKKANENWKHCSKSPVSAIRHSPRARLKHPSSPYSNSVHRWWSPQCICLQDKVLFIRSRHIFRLARGCGITAEAGSEWHTAGLVPGGAHRVIRIWSWCELSSRCSQGQAPLIS